MAVETVKDAVEAKDFDALYAIMADDIVWSSTSMGEKSGKDEVKAMMDGMKEKMGDITMNWSDWTAVDDSTCTVKNSMTIPDKGDVSRIITIKLNGDGKICSWSSANA